MAYTYNDLLSNLGIGGAHPGGIKLTKGLLADLPIDKEYHILDVGCGTGQTVVYLARHYQCQVTGLDKSQRMVIKANDRVQKEHVKADIIQGATESLPFATDTFHIIMSESVTSFTDILYSFQEYARVLKPNGRLILIEMTNHALTDEDIQVIQSFYQTTAILSKQEWIEVAANFGFSLVEATEVNPYVDGAIEMETPGEIDETMLDLLLDHQLLNQAYTSSLTASAFHFQLKGK